MENKTYNVYELTNDINNKKYIGITTMKLSYRHGKNGNGYKNNLLLFNDICEYGWENFYDNIIKSFDNKKDATKYAEDIIIKNNYRNESYGYNHKSWDENKRKKIKDKRSEYIAQHLELCKKDVINFYNKNNRFPRHDEINVKNGFGYSYTHLVDTFREMNLYYNEWIAEIDCFSLIKPNVKYYDKYIEKLLYLFHNENKTSTTNLSIFLRSECCKKYSLPSMKWFINNCPNKDVINSETFKEYIGISKKVTKEQCKNVIIKMSNEMNRPLMYDDFRGSEYGKPLLYSI